MLRLALSYNNGPVFLKDIAREENISEKYLSQLVIPLKTNSLIFALRGAHGGYQLSKPPSQITLKDIVQALEGHLSPVECVQNPSICSKANDCSVRDVWENLYEKIADTLDSTTLKELLEVEKLKQTYKYIHEDVCKK